MVLDRYLTAKPNSCSLESRILTVEDGTARVNLGMRSSALKFTTLTLVIERVLH
jgi:hypothetical protein